MDVDRVEAGEDFVEAIETSVASCDVLIAVIGRRWLDASDEGGKRRLDNPEDFVRLEISAALRRRVRVIPVLLDGALTPRASELPTELQPLVRRQAVEIRYNRFEDDSERLVDAVNGIFEKVAKEAAIPTPISPPTQSSTSMSAPTPNVTSDPKFYRGRGREYDKAIGDYTEVIRSDPNYAAAYYNRGLAYATKGDYDKAIGDNTEVIRSDPNYAAAYCNRGLAYATKGDYDKAISDYTEVIRLDPNYTAAYYNRGIAYGDATIGEYDKAISDYTEVIRLNPNYALAYYNRGFGCGIKGDYDKAISDYTEAIRLDPDYALAYYNRGITYRRMVEWAKMLKQGPIPTEQNTSATRDHSDRRGLGTGSRTLGTEVAKKPHETGTGFATQCSGSFWLNRHATVSTFGFRS
jgi:lipoprotein NlpI